jgi:hypothetical protein
MGKQEILAIFWCGKDQRSDCLKFQGGLDRIILKWALRKLILEMWIRWKWLWVESLTVICIISIQLFRLIPQSLKLLLCVQYYKSLHFHPDMGLVNGSLTPGTRASGHESRVRPSVDSLLDELNTAVPNGQVHNFYIQGCKVGETGLGHCSVDV